MARGQNVKIVDLPMNKIKLGRNSRLAVSKEDLSGLMQSINATGLLEPIGVVEGKGGGYEIAYGNRRFMAFSRLGLHSIPAIVHKRRDDKLIDVMNLAENVQRRNISLQEIGRYASILEGEGLGKKELAVRLGVSNSYLDACLAAFKEVPKGYRDDLEVQTTSQKRTPGKISIKSATSIVNAAKSFALGKADVNILYEAAKSDSRFSADSIPKYAAAIKRGNKDPIGTVKPVKVMQLRIMVDEDEYERLEKKYVLNGPFRSVTAALTAVLMGKVSERVKII